MESFSKTLVLVVISSFFLSTASAEGRFKRAITCPSGWTTNTADSTCFKYVADMVDYAAAQTACSNDGGALASVLSQDEHNFILTNIWPSVTGDYVYLGASDSVVEDTWQWNDGSPWNFESWGVWNRQQLPVHGNVHNCLAMTKVTDTDGDWYDFRCTDNAHYLCKKDATVTSSTSTCSMGDGRNWNLIADKCYFLVRGMKNWQRSENNCVNMGAQLASIHDSTVNDFFTNTWVQRYGRGMWVGLNDKSTDGSFVWTDSTTSGFANWATINGVQQPESTNLKNCVGLESPARGLAGQWNDYKCSMRAWSICQKDAIIT